jgi:hypothetical protein
VAAIGATDTGTIVMPPCGEGTCMKPPSALPVDITEGSASAVAVAAADEEEGSACC